MLNFISEINTDKKIKKIIKKKESTLKYTLVRNNSAAQNVENVLSIPEI